MSECPNAGKRARNIWSGMIQRCSNPKRDRYLQYGGRGIRVCKRWLVFTNFVEDMGLPPHGEQLDRIDPNGNYEPGNCRWIEPRLQARNTRRNVKITIGGKTQLLTDWSLESGVAVSTARARRIRGWSWEKAFSIKPGETPRRDSSTGIRGVRRRGTKWIAQITLKGNRRYLGKFDTPEAAQAAFMKEKCSNG